MRDVTTATANMRASITTIAMTTFLPPRVRAPARSLARLRVGGLGFVAAAADGLADWAASREALTGPPACGAAVCDRGDALAGDGLASPPPSAGGAHLSSSILTRRFYHTPPGRARTAQRAQASSKRDEGRTPSLHTRTLR